MKTINRDIALRDTDTQKGKTILSFSALLFSFFCGIYLTYNPEPYNINQLNFRRS